MKYCPTSLPLATALACLAVSQMGAQSLTTEYTTDINGRQVPVSASKTNAQGERTEISDSLNGRRVPREQTETRVLSESPTGRVTETITRKFNPEGGLVYTERAVSEQQKQGEDHSTQRVTIYRSDVNGAMQESERRSIDTVKQGGQTTSNVVLLHPSLNGIFDPYEKRTIVTTAGTGKTQEDQVTYRPSVSGQFTEAQREIRETQKSGDVTTSSVAEYEPDFTGTLHLHSQQSSTTTTAPDGSSTTKMNIYSQDFPGGVRDQNAAQKLLEERTIVRTKDPDGSIVEQTTIQQPTPRDPTRLEAPRKISETVCTGKCDNPPEL